MDPLSVAASVLTVLATAGKTVQGLEQLWSLKDTSKDLLCIKNEATTLRDSLRNVENALRSLGSSHDPSAQSAILSIDRLRVQAQAVLKELDGLAQRLQKPSKGPAQKPKVAKIAWLRQQKNLVRLQGQIQRVSQNLTLSFTTLVSLQLANQSQHLPLNATFFVQGVSTLEDGRLFGFSATQRDPIQTQQNPIISSQAISEIQSATVPPLDGTRTIEPSTITPALAPPTSMPSGLPSSSTINIRINIGPKKCNHFCKCQCHARSHVGSPEWVHRVFGSLYLRTNRTPLRNRQSCNYHACKRTRRTSAQLRYYTPSWLLSRAVYLTIVNDNLSGINAYVAFSSPRIIPGNSLVWSLVGNGSEERLLDMLAEGQASIYDVDRMGNSLLKFAATKCQPQICRRLIALGADPLFCSDDGFAPFNHGLDIVFMNPPPKLVSTESISIFLAEFATDDNIDSLGFTSFHKIVLGLCNLDLRMQFRLCGLEMNETDKAGSSPLWWAATRGDIETLRTLIDLGADVQTPDCEGTTPLHSAVCYSNLDCVKLLLAAGAKVDAVRHLDGKQPIHFVCSSQDDGPDTMDALIAHGADPNARDSDGNTPLHRAANRKGEAVIKNMRHLVLKGVDVDAVNHASNSPAMVAVIGDDARVLRCLIELDARLDLKNDLGGNILQLATLFATFECWDVLETAARQGKLRDVDTKAMHEGHALLNCLGKCRDESFPGKRRDREEERRRFTKLVQVVEQHAPRIWELEG